MTSAAVDLGGTRIKLGLIEGSILKYFKIIPASLDLQKWALKSFALPIVVENDANKRSL